MTFHDHTNLFVEKDEGGGNWQIHLFDHVAKTKQETDLVKEIDQRIRDFIKIF